MHESRFWRLIALSAVIGLFYVGHGLHGGGAIAMPENAAHAGAPWGRENRTEFYTSSEDGKTLYKRRDYGANHLDFEGRAVATEPEK